MAILAFIAVAMLLASRLIRRIGLANAAENRLLALLVALSLITPVVLAVGSVSLLAAQAVTIVAALLLLLAQALGPKPKPSPKMCPLQPFEWCCVVVTALSLACALLSALAPATGWDATVAHLALPAAYAREGYIGLQPGNVYAGYPHFAHVLYALAYYPQFEKPATLLSWLFAALACALVFALGARAHNRRVGFIAMAIFATTPIFVDQSDTVSIDLLFAAYTAGALCALLAWRDEGLPVQLITCGLLAGASCGIRHTGYLVCVLLAVGVLIWTPGWKKRFVFTFLVCAFITSAPWWIRSWILVGNPLFPFLAEWFPSPVVEHLPITAIGAHETVQTTGGLSIMALVRFPWDIIMRPNLYDGWSKSPGVLVLALGLPGLFFGSGGVRYLGAFSGAGLVAFFSFQRFARYLLPFFLPMMVAAAVAAESIRPLRRPIQVLLVITFAYGLALHAAAVHFKVPVVLGLQSAEEYLTSRVERYGAFSWANRNCPDGKVLTIDQRSYFLNMPSYQNHWAMLRLGQMTLDAQLAWLEAEQIRYLILPLDYLSESPALREVLRPMVQRWREDHIHFRELQSLSLPRRGGGIERVEIYEFLGKDPKRMAAAAVE